MRKKFLLPAGVAAMSAVCLVLPASAASAPTAPATCSAAKVDGAYDVTWSAPGNDGGSPVTQYRVREHGYTNPALRPGASTRSVTWTDAIRDTADVRFT